MAKICTVQNPEQFINPALLLNNLSQTGKVFHVQRGVFEVSQFPKETFTQHRGDILTALSSFTYFQIDGIVIQIAEHIWNQLTVPFFVILFDKGQQAKNVEFGIRTEVQIGQNVFQVIFVGALTNEIETK